MEYAYFSFVSFLAGVLTGLTGFGVATISMALLPFLFPLQLAIPLVATTSTIATGTLALRKDRMKLIRQVRPLLMGSVVGVPLGLFVLATVSGHALTVTVGVLLVAYALYGLFVKEGAFPFSLSHMPSGATGMMAGFLGATVNVQGPIIGLHTSSNRTLTPKEARELVAMYMFLTGGLTIVGHFLAGRITPEIIRYVLVAFPFLFLGIVTGAKLFNHVNVAWVKKGVLFLALASGLMLLF